MRLARPAVPAALAPSERFGLHPQVGGRATLLCCYRITPQQVEGLYCDDDEGARTRNPRTPHMQMTTHGWDTICSVSAARCAGARPCSRPWQPWQPPGARFRRTFVVAPRCLACGGSSSSLVGGLIRPSPSTIRELVSTADSRIVLGQGGRSPSTRELACPPHHATKHGASPRTRLGMRHRARWPAGLITARSRADRGEASKRTQFGKPTCERNERVAGGGPTTTPRAISFARRSAATPSRAKRSEHQQYAAAGSRHVRAAHHPRNCCRCRGPGSEFTPQDMRPSPQPGSRQWPQPLAEPRPELNMRAIASGEPEATQTRQ